MLNIKAPGNELLESLKKIQMKRKKTLTGIITSDKMDKTVVLKVSRRVLEPRFGKYVTKKAKYKAHCEDNNAHIGDTVVIVESRPLSKDKRWKVIRVLTSKNQVDSQALGIKE